MAAHLLQNDAYCRALSRFIGYEVEFELIFKKSDGNKTSANFHSDCAACGPNVSVIRLDNGSLIGGYTVHSWNVPAATYWPDPTAFLFSLGPTPAKYPHVGDGTNAVYTNPPYYCTFGAGHDLLITGTTAAGKKTSYNVETTTLLGGASREFDELQVFKVRPRAMPERVWPGADYQDSFVRDPEKIGQKITWLNARREVINLALCGFMGNGKTSFMASSATASQQQLVMPGIIHNGSSSVTSEHWMWPLNQYIRIYDCPGEKSAGDLLPYHNGEYILLDEGRIPNGFPMTEWPIVRDAIRINSRLGNREFRVVAGNVPFQNRMHCRAWILRASFVSDPVMQRIRAVHALCTRSGMQFAIILTGVEEVDKTLEANPENTFRSEIIEELVKRVSTGTGVPVALIAPVVNYVGHRRPSKNPVDGLILLALEMLINMAESFVRGQALFQ